MFKKVTKKRRISAHARKREIVESRIKPGLFEQQKRQEKKFFRPHNPKVVGSNPAPATIWGGHFRCPPHFCQYSCGFAGFWTENPENGFTVDVQGKIRSETPQAGLPPDFSGRRPRFFAFCGSFPRCQMCRSLRLSNRQVDESPKRLNSSPQNTRG